MTDPETFELCLKYSDSFTPKEMKFNLQLYGFKIIKSKGSLIENLEFLTSKNIDISSES